MTSSPVIRLVYGKRTYDENVEKLCHEGHSLPILHRISSDYNTLRFKNIACVYCNVGDSFNNFTKLSCGFMSVDMAAHSYSQTLNLRVLDTDKGKDESQEKQHISFTERAILPISNTDVCPSGYIALLVRTLLLLYTHCPKIQKKTFEILITFDSTKIRCLMFFIHVRMYFI